MLFLRKSGMNVKRFLLGMILVIILAALLSLLYTYYRPHRNIADEKLITATAIELFSAFENNEATANSKYLDKAIMVSGIIDEIKVNQEKKYVIVLRTNDPIYGVVCTMSKNILNVTVNDSVSLQGFCSGFTGDVVLRECMLLGTE